MRPTRDSLVWNEILLGYHHINGKDVIYPLTLRGDLPAYLLKGKKNLEPGNIENLGFAKRARQYMYRGRRVLLKILELDLGEIIAKLSPLYVIKV